MFHQIPPPFSLGPEGHAGRGFVLVSWVHGHVSHWEGHLSSYVAIIASPSPHHTHTHIYEPCLMWEACLACCSPYPHCPLLPNADAGGGEVCSPSLQPLGEAESSLMIKVVINSIVFSVVVD
jgi:hypothetical protein